MTDILIDEDLIEKIKARDSRYRDIDTGLKIEQELRESLVIRLVMEAASKEASEALEELADVAPHDEDKIKTIQARVYRARFIGRTIQFHIKKGEAAQRSVLDEHSNKEEFVNE